MTKSELRSLMRRRRRALPLKDRIAHGEAFCERLARTRLFRQSRAIACYMPVFGELDTRPLMQHALDTGRQVYLPVVDGDRMWFCQWHGQTLHVNRHSRLPQPTKDQKRLLNVRSLDLVIVPLVAFSRSGARVGQGGGYYDRAFRYQRNQTWRQPTLLGAAHDFQEHEQIPSDPWDIPMAGIVTNREVIL